MSKKILLVLTGLVVLFAVLVAVNGPISEAEAGEVPAKGMVTMVDLGATTCIPCKMMAPIMKKLERTYEGKAAISFIDVRKHPREGRKFGMGSTIAAFSLAFSIGMAIGPILSGAIRDLVGINSVFYFGAVMMIVGTGLFTLFTGGVPAKSDS